jgi:SAM-dependent methyltransferase
VLTSLAMRLKGHWRLLRRGGRGAGPRFACNLCGWNGASLQRGGDAAELHCPACKSANRHRLIAWYLRHNAARLLPPGTRVLHVAPEAPLAALVRAMPGISYESCDIARRDVTHRLDLQTEAITPAGFGLVLINHVLEHVPDDRAVLRNLFGTMVAGGICIVTVPMRAGGLPTDEDPAVISPAERLRRFGQSDHLRIYGPDMAVRMGEAGFDVDVVTSGTADAGAVARHAMGGEVIFVGNAREGSSSFL